MQYKLQIEELDKSNNIDNSFVFHGKGEVSTGTKLIYRKKNKTDFKSKVIYTFMETLAQLVDYPLISNLLYQRYKTDVIFPIIDFIPIRSKPLDQLRINKLFSKESKKTTKEQGFLPEPLYLMSATENEYSRIFDKDALKNKIFEVPECLRSCRNKEELKFKQKQDFFKSKAGTSKLHSNKKSNDKSYYRELHKTANIIEFVKQKSARLSLFSYWDYCKLDSILKNKNKNKNSIETLITKILVFSKPLIDQQFLNQTEYKTNNNVLSKLIKHEYFVNLFGEPILKLKDFLSANKGNVNYKKNSICLPRIYGNALTLILSFLKKDKVSVATQTELRLKYKKQIHFFPTIPVINNYSVAEQTFSKGQYLNYSGEQIRSILDETTHKRNVLLNSFNLVLIKPTLTTEVTCESGLETKNKNYKKYKDPFILPTLLLQTSCRFSEPCEQMICNFVDQKEETLSDLMQAFVVSNGFTNRFLYREQRRFLSFTNKESFGGLYLKGLTLYDIFSVSIFRGWLKPTGKNPSVKKESAHVTVTKNKTTSFVNSPKNHLELCSENKFSNGQLKSWSYWPSMRKILRSYKSFRFYKWETNQYQNNIFTSSPAYSLLENKEKLHKIELTIDEQNQNPRKYSTYLDLSKILITPLEKDRKALTFGKEYDSSTQPKYIFTSLDKVEKSLNKKFLPCGISLTLKRENNNIGQLEPTSKPSSKTSLKVMKGFYSPWNQIYIPEKLNNKRSFIINHYYTVVWGFAWESDDNNQISYVYWDSIWLRSMLNNRQRNGEFPEFFHYMTANPKKNDSCIFCYNYRIPKVKLPRYGAAPFKFLLAHFDPKDQLPHFKKFLVKLINNLNKKITELEILGSYKVVNNVENEYLELKKLRQKRDKHLRRTKLVHNFVDNRTLPEWMILDNLPVLPPGLRPIIKLDENRPAVSDLNKLYQLVLIRNNRLKSVLQRPYKSQITPLFQRSLQEAVDALLENGKGGGAAVSEKRGDRSIPIKSLSDILKGKKGRFRQNLLGKRVDYSGRSVIVVAPELKTS